MVNALTKNERHHFVNIQRFPRSLGLAMRYVPATNDRPRQANFPRGRQLFLESLLVDVVHDVSGLPPLGGCTSATCRYGCGRKEAPAFIYTFHVWEKKKKQKLFHVPYTFQRTRDIVEHAFTDRCDYSSTVLVMIHPSSCSPSSRCFFPFFSFLLFIGRFSFLGSDVASPPSFTFRFFKFAFFPVRLTSLSRTRGSLKSIEKETNQNRRQTFFKDNNKPTSFLGVWLTRAEASKIKLPMPVQPSEVWQLCYKNGA